MGYPCKMTPNADAMLEQPKAMVHSSCRILTPLVLLLLAATRTSPAGPTTRHTEPVVLPSSHPWRPVFFEPNQGQAGRIVQFLSRGPRSTLFLMAGGRALLRLPNGTLQMNPGRAAARPRAAGIEPLSGTINYFFGNDRSKWRTNMAAYSAVKFERVYPDIDLVYRGGSDQLEYDFIVSPGGDPGVISLDFSGADRIELDGGGNLLFSLHGKTVQHCKPHVYQLAGRARREIPGRYVMAGAHRIRFEIGAYDRRLPLIIDPVVSYATFLGGTGNDGAFSIALDRAGNIYLAGITRSLDFPRTTGSIPGRTFPDATDATDAFVAKLNPQGTALLYATSLGGSEGDTVMSVAADAEGNAYVTGGTTSKDFPVTPGAFQTRFGGTGGHSLPPFSSPAGDGFVAKLDPTGSALVYSSYLGGTGIDQGYGIAVDSSGSAYVAGATESPDFPVTQGVFQSTRRGSTDIFIARINSAGTGLLYSTYLGGSDEDYAFSLAVDSSGSTYVTGVTSSDDFPINPGAFQSHRTGGASGYVAKLNSTGTALVYSTYLGGNNRTYAYGLAIDGAGDAYVTGVTTATDFPATAGAFQSRSKPAGQGGDVFVTQLSPSGSSLVYSSVFGGNGSDTGYAIAVDESGSAYITGATRPYGNGPWIDFPTTPDAAQRCGTGNPAAFLAQLSAGGTALKYSSYLGGGPGGGSVGMAIALDTQGRVYLAGSTSLPSFPVTSGALQTILGGGSRSFDSTNLYPFAGDAFLAQVDLSVQQPFTLSCVADSASLKPNWVSPGEIVSFFGSGIGPTVGVVAALDAGGHLPTSLANTRVLFDGSPVPLLFVRSDQVNVVAPFGLFDKTSTQVQIEYQGVKSGNLSIPVNSANPGIFTFDSSGSGQAAALNEDGSYNTPYNPASPGSIVVLFATGAGKLDPVPEDGAVIRGTPPQTVPASAYIGYCPAEVLSSGGAPGLIAGAIQVRVRVPDQAPPPAPPGVTCGRGDVAVVLLFGGIPSQEVATISVR